MRRFRKLAVGLLAGLLLFTLMFSIICRYGTPYFLTLKPHSHWAQITLFSGAHLLGKIEAQWESLTGSPILKVAEDTYKSIPWENEMETLMKERYSVKVDRYAGDASSPWWLGYSRGYNSVTESKIEKKHGSGALTLCAKDAVASYKSKIQ